MIIARTKNFDLDQIYKSGQCFRWEKCTMFGYRIPISDEEIWIYKYGTDLCARCDNENNVKDYFDLETDYLKIETEVYHTHDKYLIKAMNTVRESVSCDKTCGKR